MGKRSHRLSGWLPSRPNRTRQSVMPSMLDRVEQEPIFDYEDLITRHRPPGLERPPRVEPERPRAAVPSHLPRLPLLSDPCATWLCPGCGRSLISAVHPPSKTPSTMYCTRACKTAHGG